MEAEDFAIPSPKRQRTDSPDEAPIVQPQAATNLTTKPAPSLTDVHQQQDLGQAEGDSDQNEILDVLMQHVESEATPFASAISDPVTLPDLVKPAAGTQDSTSPQLEIPDKQVLTGGSESIQLNFESFAKVQTHAQTPVEGERDGVNRDEQLNEQPTSQPRETDQAERQVDGIPPTEAVEPVDGADGPEWEVDSSPYESSTDTSTDSSSSDDSEDGDEDEDNDYAMLDPEEAARILMHGDGGSDDEGDKGKSKGEGSGLKTANEKFEDVPVIPDIVITEDMKIEELGSVEAIVENNVLIKGKVSGEYQVLESGSLLCLENRAIAGVVAEPLGRVEQPLYTVRFATEQDIKDKGLFEKGTVVFYVPQHSSFVFTQPLKAFKGSDASNFHDEEVGDEEMEFSDDEAEAEHKRQLKLKRQGRLGDSSRGRGSSRGGRGGQRGDYKPSPLSTDVNGAAYGNGSLEMNYDDVEEGEEGYTPLTRPTNFNEMMSPARSDQPPMAPPPFSDRGRVRGHHRGRGHDRGGRGGRGNFRGNNSRGGSYQQQHNHDYPPQQSPQYPDGGLPNAFPQAQFPPLPHPPSAPTLTPQNPAYPFSAISSPISPLPKQQFNFGAAFQVPQQPFSPNFQHQPQQPWNQHMPNTFPPQMNPAVAMQFAQQFQQQFGTQQQQQQQQHSSSGWQVNQAAAAEVQRQLEEMRRNQQGGGGGGH